MGGWPLGETDLNQDRRPLRQETEVVGHSVFFTYLYAGAADAYMETGDTSLLVALDRLWHDLTEKKMYVTSTPPALTACGSITTAATRSTRDYLMAVDWSSRKPPSILGRAWWN